MKDHIWTIHNWQSELKRLEALYKKIENKQSEEAVGIMDHICAVQQIIQDIENQNLYEDK